MNQLALFGLWNEVRSREVANSRHQNVTATAWFEVHLNNSVRCKQWRRTLYWQLLISVPVLRRVNWLKLQQGGNAVDLCSGGASFQCRPGHCLCWLKFPWFSSILTGKCRDFVQATTTSFRSFASRQLSLHPGMCVLDPRRVSLLCTLIRKRIRRAILVAQCTAAETVEKN